MSAVLNFAKDPAFKAALTRGLFVVVVLLSLLAGILQFFAADTIQRLESRLPSQDISIERVVQAASSHSTADAAPSNPKEHIRESESPHGMNHETKPDEQPVQAPEKLQTSTKMPLIAQVQFKDDPFKAYKRPYQPQGKPVIAVAIRDFGLSDSVSDKILKALPPEISLLLSPYAKDAKAWGQRARQNGHEFWMTLPIESSGDVQSDPGSKALSSSSSLAHNEDVYEWAKASATEFPGYAGYTDVHYVSAQTTSKPTFRKIFTQKFGFLELNPVAPEFVETLAVAANAPYAKTTTAKAGALGKQHLLELFMGVEKEALNNGYAVLVIEPFPSVVDELANWASSLPSKNFELAPASAIASAAVQLKAE